MIKPGPEDIDQREYLELVGRPARMQEEIRQAVEVIKQTLETEVYDSLMKTARAMVTGSPNPTSIRYAGEMYSNAARKKAKTLATQMAETELKKVSEIVAEGVSAGDHPFKIARQLKDVKGLDSGRAKQFDKYRAAIEESKMTAGQKEAALAREHKRLLNDRKKVIAQAETRYATSTGNREKALGRGQTHHVWMTSGDDRVSDGCLANGLAGMVEIDKPFPSGHMTPPRHPRCRCTVAYVTKDKTFPEHEKRIAESNKINLAERGLPPDTKPADLIKPVEVDDPTPGTQTISQSVATPSTASEAKAEVDRLVGSGLAPDSDEVRNAKRAFYKLRDAEEKAAKKARLEELNRPVSQRVSAFEKPKVDDTPKVEPIPPKETQPILDLQSERERLLGLQREMKFEGKDNTEKYKQLEREKSGVNKQIREKEQYAWKKYEYEIDRQKRLPDQDVQSIAEGAEPEPLPTTGLGITKVEAKGQSMMVYERAQYRDGVMEKAFEYKPMSEFAKEVGDPIKRVLVEFDGYGNTYRAASTKSSYHHAVVNVDGEWKKFTFRGSDHFGNLGYKGNGDIQRTFGVDLQASGKDRKQYAVQELLVTLGYDQEDVKKYGERLGSLEYLEEFLSNTKRKVKGAK